MRRTDGAELEIEAGKNFWDVMTTRFNVAVVTRTLTENHTIPPSGSVLIVANHPNGVMDGLAIGAHIQSIRPDFKILAQAVFNQVNPLADYILPVSFGETSDAIQINLKARQDAIAFLKAGGCVCVFPAGGVSTSRRPFGKAKDTRWRTFTAKLAVLPGVTIVPIHIAGQNSRLFQIISRLSDTLRKAMLIHEFRRRVGTQVHLSVGAPLIAADIDTHRNDPVAMMEFLYTQTYNLAPIKPIEPGYGYEFDHRYRS